jgi:hypothetical protein
MRLLAAAYGAGRRGNRRRLPPFTRVSASVPLRCRAACTRLPARSNLYQFPPMRDMRGGTPRSPGRGATWRGLHIERAPRREQGYRASGGCTERRSARARRARITSICAQAIRHAIRKRSPLTCGPAMRRASSAIRCVKARSRLAGRVRPCCSALREERGLPSGVFGPRLRRPFLRLASRLASLIMPLPSCYVPVLFLDEFRGKCKQESLALVPR